MCDKSRQSNGASEHLKEMQRSIDTIRDPALKKTLIRVLSRLKSTRIEKDVRELGKEVMEAPVKEEQLVVKHLGKVRKRDSLTCPIYE